MIKENEQASPNSSKEAIQIQEVYQNPRSSAKELVRGKWGNSYEAREVRKDSSKHASTYNQESVKNSSLYLNPQFIYELYRSLRIYVGEQITYT